MWRKDDTVSLGPISELNETRPLLNGRESTLRDDGLGRKEGISVSIATVYIIGLVAGSGMIALPKVIFEAGWYGIISLAVLVFVGYFTALTLSKCWIILYNKYPKYRKHVRHPFVAICYVAFGKTGGPTGFVTTRQRAFRWERVFAIGYAATVENGVIIIFSYHNFLSNFKTLVMHFISIVMLFAVALVVLLLICDNVRLVTMQWFDISFCSWLPIVTLLLYPIVLLKTPVETQFFAIVSVLSSVLMFCLILVQIVNDGAQVGDSLREQQPVVTFSTLFIAWSTIGYSASGHACFPVYQNSMRQPMKFNYSLTIGFVCIFIFLSLPAYFSYYFLGGAVNTPESDNLLNILSDGPIKSIAGITFAVHFLMAYVFTINPLCQQIEELTGIPDRFSWQLVLIRSTLLAAHLFLAESVPQFGPLLSLVGACLWIPSAYIAPSVLFLRLRPLMSKRNYITDSTSLHLVIIGLATIVVCCCTYSSLNVFISAQSSFSVPCYVNSTAAHI